MLYQIVITNFLTEKYKKQSKTNLWKTGVQFRKWKLISFSPLTLTEERQKEIIHFLSDFQNLNISFNKEKLWSSGENGDVQVRMEMFR